VIEMAGKQELIPLIGIALLLVALIIGAMHSPLKLAACGLGIAVLAARAYFLSGKAKV